MEGFAAYRVGRDGSVWTRYEHADPNGPLGVRGATYVHGSWRRLGLRPNRTGYLRAVLYGTGRRVVRMVHHLVLEAFVGPRPEGACACHANDRKDDNRLENLRWDTPRANWRDRRANGLVHPRRGSDHPQAKLREGLVLLAIDRMRQGERQCQVARELGVSETTISSIRKGRTWRHVAR